MVKDKKYSPIQLVHKEADHGLRSGEGYEDPRFNVSTGDELVDRWAKYPIMGQGAGQMVGEQWKTKGGSDQIGVYYAKHPDKTLEDQVLWIDERIIPGGNVGIGNVQKHELVHRAAEKSGYHEKMVDRLVKNYGSENKTYPRVLGFSRANLETLLPILREAMAYSYEELSPETREEKLRFVINGYNIKESQKNRITQMMVKIGPKIKKDFSQYLQELEKNKKTGGGFSDSPLYSSKKDAD